MNRKTEKHMRFLPVAFFLLLTGLLVSCGAPHSERMTPERFQKIITLPADTTPLSGPLATLPFWPHCVVSNVMTYASGKVFKEEMAATAHTVGGKYIVSAARSEYYQQTMYCIVAYDARASAIKIYGLYGDGHGRNRVTEAIAVYDRGAKTYTITSAYDDFTETTTGHYTDSADSSKTLVYKAGALFLTREVETRPTGK